MGSWELLRGRLLYTDFADHKPPLLYVYYALAQLLFGHLSATQSVRYGRAEAAPDAPLRLWDEIWRTEYAPFCPDSF